VVSLDETSLSPEGQTISFPSQSVERLDIELLETTDPGFDRSRANAVGFAEIQVGNVRASESVRMPIDLLDRAGEASSELALDLVMNRSRVSPNKWDRHDEEPVLDRVFALPTTRTFSIAGTARVAATASDDLVDQIFGTSSRVNITSSSRLQGSPGARSSRAFDRDRATAWTSAFGSDLPQSILVKSPEPLDLDVVSVDVVIDQLHSAPTHISVIADGEMVGSKNLDLASNPDQALQRIDIDLSRTVRASNVRLVVDAIDARPSVSTDPNSSPLPISIAEIHMGDLPAVPTEARPTTACVDDLLEIDGRPISVRLGEELADGSFSLEGCGSTTLNAGEHRLVGTDGSGTGLNVDSLHLFSDASGPDVEDVAPPLTVTRSERTRLSAVVESDGSPFWYTNGQSFNPGWKIKVSGAEVGPQTMLNGYSTGWLITPSGAANIEIDTSWTPQRSIWFAMGLSALAVVGCFGIVVATTRRRSTVDAHDEAAEDLVTLVSFRSHAISGWRTTAVSAAISGVSVALASRPLFGVLAGLGSAISTKWTPITWVLAALAPLTLFAARALGLPELGWLAIGWVIAAGVSEKLMARSK